MRHGLLVFSIFLCALAAVSSAAADQPSPLREPIAEGDPPPITGQCAFTVLAHSEGTSYDTTFLDRFGNPTRLFATFPGNVGTVTNALTGKSLSLPVDGTFQLRASAGGSIEITITGHGFSFPHPITGEPGIWYLSGRLHETVDAEGNVTSMSSSGTLVNVCPQLA
jgi:hypothetical protein